MSDKEKFEGFKESMIGENEKKHGKEIREKYGEETINESNAKMMNMTQEQYDAFTKLGEKLSQTLVKAMGTGDPYELIDLSFFGGLGQFRWYSLGDNPVILQTHYCGEFFYFLELILSRSQSYISNKERNIHMY